MLSFTKRKIKLLSVSMKGNSCNSLEGLQRHPNTYFCAYSKSFRDCFF